MRVAACLMPLVGASTIGEAAGTTYSPSRRRRHSAKRMHPPAAAPAPAPARTEAPAPAADDGLGSSRRDGDERDTHTRSGLWLNFGPGYGSLGCHDCSRREGSWTGGLAVGGTLSQKVVIGVGTIGWSKSEKGVARSVAILTAVLRSIRHLLAVSFCSEAWSPARFTQSQRSWN